MDSKYLITKSGGFVSEDDLYHWGIKGMKWGVRRYQNPDGSLTTAGRKRYMNPDGTLNEKGKKKFGGKEAGGESSIATPSASKRASDMSDADLQARVNRLRNEDAYRDLSKKLGYDEPKTELDIQIAQMEKQKKYLELQRDINNLTPKKVSKGKKLIETLMNKVIEPAATSAGKKLLEQYLTDKGLEKLKKKADETKDKVDKSKERVEKKEEKKARREAEKAERSHYSKENASFMRSKSKYNRDSDSRFRDRVNNMQDEFGFDDDHRRSNRSGKKSEIPYATDVEVIPPKPKYSGNSSSSSGVVYDSYTLPRTMLESPVTSITTTRNTSSGSSYVSQYRSTPVSSLPSPNISGYLPAPKDDDD